MRLIFVDDSIPLDGYTPSSQPLDGPAKAFALLPGALAMRGHAVQAFSRCSYPVSVEGVEWLPFDNPRPDSTDVLIAARQAHLLGFVAAAAKRILWSTGAPAAADADSARAVLAAHRPTVVLLSKAQREAWANPLGLAAHVIAPGIAPAYVIERGNEPDDPPVAITTAHPLGGLDWLLALWTEKIRPEAPTARLHVYSAVLDQGQLGAAVPPAYASILDRARAAASQGVTIHRPLGDLEMADAYSRARVHLHPGHAGELVGFTLAESQAAGLPAVARAVSPAMVERIVDSQTGTVAASDVAFASAAIQLLTDRSTFERQRTNARRLQSGRTWPIAAAEWEGLFA